MSTIEELLTVASEMILTSRGDGGLYNSLISPLHLIAFLAILCELQTLRISLYTTQDQ
jgi:hypothetical protein